MENTLCWDCLNALGGCPWSRKFKPVKDWKATPTKVRMGYDYIDSFLVHECPLFIKDLDLKGYCQVTANLLAGLLNVSAQFINLKSEYYLIERFELLGFDLKIKSINRRRYFYIKKLKQRRL